MTGCARLWLLSCVLACTGWAAQAGPVTITEHEKTFVIANGLLTATVERADGDLISLRYRDQEMLGGPKEHGYWSHTPGGLPQVEARITIDPRTTNGERGEVAVRGIAQGRSHGSRPILDIELRYALGRGESGLATYAIFTHPAAYPATAIGEARFAAKLSRDFDFMTIDADRRLRMATPEDWLQGTQLNLKEARRLTTGARVGQVEHKYDYSALQSAIPAYGWSSTTHQIGLWFINPAQEYLSGGPTKVELTGHLDCNGAALPTLLNYWRGSHYGGSFCAIAAGENWTKVVGPFLIYLNHHPAGEDALWRDALAQATQQAAAWPYAWVAGVDYPRRAERATVRGSLRIEDPQQSAPWRNLQVGLTAADYQTTDDRGKPTTVDWQRDAKFYQFWTRADAQGRFTIPQVRPGSYTLRAIADGVLGEFTATGIQVAAGASLDLGTLVWRPVRHGRQLWEIGIADRSAAEFRHGDHFWQWGLYQQYATEFPTDVLFTIGTSSPRTDWNFVQPARMLGERAVPTTWTVRFMLPAAGQGTATLRLGIAGSRLPGGIQVGLNGTLLGITEPPPDTGVMHRDGIRGYWVERDLTFPGTALQAGTNDLTLTIPVRGWVNSVLYDYVRLELADGN